jgi:hypothetical protein
MTTATDRLLHERLRRATGARHLRQELEQVRAETAERVREATARLEQSERVLVKTSLLMTQRRRDGE